MRQYRKEYAHQYDIPALHMMFFLQFEKINLNWKHNMKIRDVRQFGIKHEYRTVFFDKNFPFGEIYFSTLNDMILRRMLT